MLAETTNNINIFFYGLLIIAAIIVLIFILLFFLRLILSHRRYRHFKVFTIRIPKEKPKDEEGIMNSQTIKEEIAKGEAVFAAIGGLRADRKLKSWFIGRDDHMSFEIVASAKKINFYLACTDKYVRYLEQQIQAQYPAAAIERVADYNSFSSNGHIMAAYLKTNKHFALPLKTYNKIEVDPMGGIINVLSKLEVNETFVIQYLIRSAKGKWHATVKNIVKRIHRKKSISAGLNSNFLASMSDFLSPTKKKESDTLANEQRLSAVEEDMVKLIEEKNLKAGLDVNLRVLSFSQSKQRNRLLVDNMSSAFTSYNNFSYGNTFSQARRKNQKRIIKDFIYRHFREKNSFLLNSEELASLFHLPLSNTETPNISWLTAKSAPAPTNLSEEGIILGYNTYRGIKKEVRIARADRRRHTYIIGKSGVGKSFFITNMVVQDILNGEGVCVLDPHGDLIEDILLRIPPERAEDVIIFSPADTSRPLALNLLEYDEKYPEQKSFVINEMINIFDKLYDLKSTGGPMFEQYMRNAMLLIMEDPDSGSTLMEIPKVLADEDFRRLKLQRCPNKTVVDFWVKEAEKAGGEAALANIVPYVTSKLTSFISNDMMRPIIGQQKSAFNLREVMDQQKILLVDLPKGMVGETNAYLLGMIMVGKILMAALSRTDMSSEDRKDFYLYIDEFQNFTTDSISQILSEARKYALNLIVAHQYIGQLSKNNNDEIKNAIFGNVGTIVSFKIGSEDAEFLLKEFAPIFNEFDLINIEKYTAYIKLLVDNSASRPFSISAPWPLPGTERKEVAESIRSLSKIKYGKDIRLVEAEIANRTEGIDKLSEATEPYV